MFEELNMKRQKKSSVAKIHIGISGWTYTPWRGVFFPRGWVQKRELEYAAHQVSSIEINGTFYSLQRPKSFKVWHDATPDEFVFSVKAPRYITHIRRLSDVETPIANFFASGVLLLGDKLGPILWQLPPSLRYDPAKLGKFLEALPRTMRAAAKLAMHHDDKVASEEGVIETGSNRRIQHALEVRHESFACAEFVQQLRKYQVALVVADTAGKWPFMEDVTGDFVYVRLHGDEKLYVSGYTSEALDEWERKIRSWAKGSIPKGSKLYGPRKGVPKQARDVFVYFDNDVKVHAPFDAMTLAHQLEIADAPAKRERPTRKKIKRNKVAELKIRWNR